MDFNFLVSSERSGSNLVTKIMDAHPDICGPSPKHLIRVMGLDHYRYGDLSRAQVWNRLLEDVNLILRLITLYGGLNSTWIGCAA